MSIEQLHSNAFESVRCNFNTSSFAGALDRPGLERFITLNPNLLKTSPANQSSSILHEIVAIGDVPLLQRIIKIPGVWFPLDFVDGSGQTLAAILEGSNIRETNKRVMATFLNFLQEWDQHCEYAKFYLDSENERVWAWLRRNSQHCYTCPPSRKWSIAMQVVYSGNVDWMVLLLRLCPQARGQAPVWEVRGNDGLTLLDVAHQVSDAFPAMFEFIQSRTNGEVLPNHPIQQLAVPAVPVVELQPSAPALIAVEESPSPVPVPPVAVIVDDMAEVRGLWDGINAASIRRPYGECMITRSGEREQLYICSRDCNHAFGEEGLGQYLRTKLQIGPFPVRCPQCSTEGTDRGFVTRGTIKALVLADILTLVEGQRLLRQQMRFLPDEASFDLQYSMSKPCPYCSTPIAHYKGHGCHHIRPGGGCPSCHHHFCYTCLSSHDDGAVWQGCPNDDSLFCTADCDCPLCPDCSPGNSCDACDGPNGQCPRCKRV